MQPLLQGEKLEVLYILSVCVCSLRYHISFTLIPWILTGLQNPYGYGNSQYCTQK